MSELLTVKQVADFLGVSVSTLTLWRKKGRGPIYHKRGYRMTIYKRSDVEAFAKEHGYDIT